MPTSSSTTSTPRCRDCATTSRASADLADVYADASPDLFDGLDSAVTTARTFNAQTGDVDAALMAASGSRNTAAEPLERARPT